MQINDDDDNRPFQCHCPVAQRQPRLALVLRGHQRSHQVCIRHLEQRTGNGCPICRAVSNMVLRLSVVYSLISRSIDGGPAFSTPVKFGRAFSVPACSASRCVSVAHG